MAVEPRESDGGPARPSTLSGPSPPSTSSKVDVLVGEGDPGDDVEDVAEFGARGAEELSPGWGVEKEVADLDGGAFWRAGDFRLADPPALDYHLVGRVGPTEAGDQSHLGDGPDARECLAAEAEGGDEEEVVGGSQFARSVGAETHRHVLGVHPAAVVGHPHEFASAFLQLNFNAGGAGVN